MQERLLQESLCYTENQMRISSRTIIASSITLCLVAGFFFASRNKNMVALFQRNVDFFAFYQNLANPYIRYVRIPEGLRKEEVADIYAHTLAWNDQDVKQFLGDSGTTQSDLEGYYFPSTYILPVDASGEDVKNAMLDKFDKNVTSVTNSKNDVIDKNKVSMDTILKVASLIQREAAGKQDMNLISGIIWNRIWNGMSLDIDATLQYAKGTDANGWWPQVLSKDKNINSPYNTYKNEGLPPTPIANPGLDAIKAAYNPTKTNCIFYFHDNNHQIHCSKTYEQHKSLIAEYLK